MSNSRKGKIAYALQAINIIPLLLFAIIILLVTVHRPTLSLGKMLNFKKIFCG